MSIGFPDGQRITQWLGSPVVKATAAAIGNVLHTDGPFNLASWASIVVAIKPTGGQVTVTVRQRVTGGAVTLELPQTFIVNPGSVLFESIVLFGDEVYVDLTGSAPGVTVDYAVYPSNTTTNAQVLANATINLQHNDVLVAAEPTLDLEDARGLTWTIVDDAPGTRLKITPQRVLAGLRGYPSAARVIGTGGANAGYMLIDSTLFGSTGFSQAGVGIIVPDTGYYDCTGLVEWAANAAGSRTINFRVLTGGAGFVRDEPALVQQPVNGDVTRMGYSLPIQLNAGQQIALLCQQTSGGNVNLNTGVLSAMFLGA